MRRPLARSTGEFRDASLFIVATEGACTEPRYFTLFRSRRLKINIIGCENGKSSPAWVLDRLDKYAKKYQFGAGDTFWVVIDRDRWTEKDLAEVHGRCKKAGISLIISNPNFEIWLAFHFDGEIPTDGKKSVIGFLRKNMGSYSKKNFPLSGLLEASPDACVRARARDKDGAQLWPEVPGSRLYLLVEAILACAKDTIEPVP